MRPNAFWLKRLFSLSGVVPVGAFLLEHVFANARIMYGREAYNQAVRDLWGLPYLVVLEALFIWIPIVFHAAVGLMLIATGTAWSQTVRYRYFHNWMYVLQRVTGIVTLVFMIWHFATTRGYDMAGYMGLSLLRDAAGLVHASLTLSGPWGVLWYLLGIVCASFHFANGLWGFTVTWGIAIGERAQRRAYYACTAVFVVLSLVGIRAVEQFLTVL